MTPTRTPTMTPTMTPTTSYSPSNYDNVTYSSITSNNIPPVPREIAKVNLDQPIKANSPSISISNVDPSALSAFKEGNIIKSDDGSSYTIKSVIITYYTPSPTSNANYSENFKEGIDGAVGSIKSVTIVLDRPTESEITSLVVLEPTTPNSYNTTPATNSSVSSDIDLTNATNTTDKKVVNDNANGVNTKFISGSQYNSYNSAMPNASYISNYGSQHQSQISNNQSGPSSNPILRGTRNNVFQSGNMSVNLAGQLNNDTPGQLPSISENKTQVNFPTMDSPSDMYSYYGALRSKGADYVPFNSISETNKKLGRLGYVPPNLPMNYDFTYYGALPSKGANNAKAANALQGPNQNNYTEYILDRKLYTITGQPGYEELPIPNRIDYMKLPPEVNANQVSTFSSTPIDSYSQYGALRSKE